MDNLDELNTAIASIVLKNDQISMTKFINEINITPYINKYVVLESLIVLSCIYVKLNCLVAIIKYANDNNIIFEDMLIENLIIISMEKCACVNVLYMLDNLEYFCPTNDLLRDILCKAQNKMSQREGKNMHELNKEIICALCMKYGLRSDLLTSLNGLNYYFNRVNISYVFALIVTYADNYFTLKDADTLRNCNGSTQLKIYNANNACKLFKITSRLPLELQMMIAHRLFGSMNNIVLSSELNKVLHSVLNPYLSNNEK